MTFAALRAVIAALVAAAIVGVLSMLYANHVAQQSARRQCAVLSAEVAVYREEPPTTKTGQRLAAEKEALLRGLRCR